MEIEWGVNWCHWSIPFQVIVIPIRGDDMKIAGVYAVCLGVGPFYLEFSKP